MDNDRSSTAFGYSRRRLRRELNKFAVGSRQQRKRQVDFWLACAPGGLELDGAGNIIGVIGDKGATPGAIYHFGKHTARSVSKAKELGEAMTLDFESISLNRT